MVKAGQVRCAAAGVDQVGRDLVIIAQWPCGVSEIGQDDVAGAVPGKPVWSVDIGIVVGSFRGDHSVEPTARIKGIVIEGPDRGAFIIKEDGSVANEVVADRKGEG